MMKFCGDDGSELSCEKNGVLVFSGDLRMVCTTAAFLCKVCDKMILAEHGAWRETHIEEINLKPRYNISLQYDHYSARRDSPICVDCGRIMNFMGDGILLDKTEHSYLKGEMWVCPQCDYVFIDKKHSSWPPPLNLEEKRELEEKYAPNMIKMGVGVIPFFQTIKEEEDKESEMMDKILESAE